ncbi:MAG: SAM-dependent methyltransferase [Gemmataceae bacterium]|nr:SAM-dependent methyltransferase [Gemmataceae bacterium]
MPPTDTDMPSARRLVTDAVLGPGFVRATFAGPRRSDGATPWVRVVVRPVDLRGGRVLQFAYFDPTKCTTKNAAGDEAAARLAEVLDLGFSGVHLTTQAEEIDVRTTKKGKVIVGRRRAGPRPVATAHDHVKDLPLPEGKADRLLEALGVLDRNGRVRPAMRAKFTQVNEFLQHLRHLLPEAGLTDLGRPVELLDCGCGSSHLTLAAHHYLNTVLGVPARVIGVDVNDELVRKSAERADELGGGVNFACGPIAAADVKPDVVLALHACDTATDDALAAAVKAEARLVLSVPCCHHALNDSIRPAGPAEVLRPVLRHGILRQRTADLVTDAFRALALRIAGYKTDVVEFVSPEHTARNLMIRAVRGVPAGEPAFVAEYDGLKRFWGVTPYIEQALGEEFRSFTAEDAEHAERNKAD